MAWTEKQIALFHKWYGEDAVPDMNEPPPSMPDAYHTAGSADSGEIMTEVGALAVLVLIGVLGGHRAHQGVCQRLKSRAL